MTRRHRSQWVNRLSLSTHALRVHVEIGIQAFETGDLYALARHRGAVGMLPEAGPESAAFAALRWRELWLSDAHHEAIEIGLSSLEMRPDDIGETLSLCTAMADTGQWQHVADALNKLLEHAPEVSEIWYQLGLAHEALGDEQARSAAFHRLYELEAEEAPDLDTVADDHQLLEALQGAIDSLPPVGQNALAGAEFELEDYPGPWVLETDVGDPRIMLVLEVDPSVSHDKAPSGVVIIAYRWNIERYCESIEHLNQILQAALKDEVEILLGLEADSLHFEGTG